MDFLERQGRGWDPGEWVWGGGGHSGLGTAGVTRCVRQCVCLIGQCGRVSLGYPEERRWEVERLAECF